MGLKNIYIIMLTGILLFAVLSMESNSQEASKIESFENPVYQGQDPWVIKADGAYYYCHSEERGISVWKSDRLTDRGIRKVVWNAPKEGWNTGGIWAPELHHLNGKWWIYYAGARDGKNVNHRMGVLEGLSADPQGDYLDRGMLYTGDDIVGKTKDCWAIDGTVLVQGDRLYFLWSGWPLTEDVQYLYIARMENPWTISSGRAKICENATYLWERIGEDQSQRGLHEGPEILYGKDKTFIVYSCSGSWQKTYKLGLLYMDIQSDPMKPENWTKLDKPVFQGTEKIHGVGHASFTLSPDDSENWIVYHSKQSEKPGWGDRAVCLQKFVWDSKGFPDFGIPVPAGMKIPVPSGESGLEK